MKDMTESASEPLTGDSLERFLASMRPKLHRYCARMTGSVIDGEDVLQDAMVKAVKALQNAGRVELPERWMFRIAHNAALDFLRRRSRLEATLSAEEPDMLEDHKDAPDGSDVVATSLRTFMRLPTVQRSTVILMDVLGYPLQEIGGIIDASVPAVKSALNRGRTRLRQLAREPEDVRPPELSSAERSLLSAYIENFNARNFDAVRDMLAEEVRVEVVARKNMHGRKEAQTYFHNYSGAEDWRMRLGFVGGRPAIIVHDARESERPRYFILVDWARENVAFIRDFRYADYAIDGADVSIAL
jgi:RNA polymerase sigma-70 factor (ECF subfamily)